MEVFDFHYNKHETVYPEEGFRLQFGNSYQFASKPSSPSQRSFSLLLVGLNYNSVVLPSPYNYTLDASRLERFYQDHKQWKHFLWQHPIEFTYLEVSFESRLKIPKPDDFGILEDVTIELLEHP